MTKLSTRINKLINQVLSESTRLNSKAQEEISGKLTHDIIQLIRNEDTKAVLWLVNLLRERK